MRVLIVHRYFWPDTPPYASMLRAIGSRWATDGHDVYVLTSQPSYTGEASGNRQPRIQNLGSICIRRVWLFRESKRNFVARLLNVIIFQLRVFHYVVFRRTGFDVVMAATTPPVVVAWAACMAAKLRGAKFIYHCQDIHPEMLRYAGLMRAGFWYRWLLNRDTRTLRRATRIVVLSGDMRRTIRRRCEAGNQEIVVINNFTVPMFVESTVTVNQESAEPSDRFRVLFAGNLGFFQGLEPIIDAARILATESNIEFVFLGDGAAKAALMHRAEGLIGRTVHFYAHRPQQEAEHMIARSDLGLITLGRDIYRVAYPSKTMTYLKVGTPLLVVVETDSELAKLVVEEKIGFVSPPGDAKAIAKSVLEAARAPAIVDSMRRKAKAVCCRLFSEDQCLNQWSSLLRGIKS